MKERIYSVVTQLASWKLALKYLAYSLILFPAGALCLGDGWLPWLMRWAYRIGACALLAAALCMLAACAALLAIKTLRARRR